MSDLSTWIPIAPLVLLMAGGLAIMLLDAFVKNRDGLALVACATMLIAGGISVAGIIAATGSDIGIGIGMDASSAALPAFITRYLAVDTFGMFFDVIICAGGALSALLASGYLREHGLERGEFYLLIVFSALGGIILARAVDLITLFIGLETMSLGIYALVAFRRTSARATEGAAKYFLLGSFAAAILLFGSALLYGATGHTDFVGIAEAVQNPATSPVLLLLGLALILVGLAFKISAFPFHMWTPDAYEGAATPATTFMAGVVKASALAILLRVLLGIFGDDISAGATGWRPVIIVLSVLSMLYGNITAVAQSNIKRMLAYSSIAHAGYLLIGVAAAPESDSAVSAILFYLLAYVISNALAFGALIWAGSRGKEAVEYKDLLGLGRRHPIVAIPFLLGMLSLMGFPPTAGFFGKYYVFSAAIEADLVWLAVFGILTSAIGAYYYLKVLVYLFMKEPEASEANAENTESTENPQVLAVPMRSGYVIGALVIAGYFVLKMGLTPANYIELALTAASSL